MFQALWTIWSLSQVFSSVILMQKQPQDNLQMNEGDTVPIKIYEKTGCRLDLAKGLWFANPCHGCLDN